MNDEVLSDITNIYCNWMRYWTLMYSYPVDMDEVKALRIEIDRLQKKVLEHERKLLEAGYE